VQKTVSTEQTNAAVQPRVPLLAGGVRDAEDAVQAEQD
jgi:hypothetical protein